jgi:hypothetical protein
MSIVIKLMLTDLFFSTLQKPQPQQDINNFQLMKAITFEKGIGNSQ